MTKTIVAIAVAIFTASTLSAGLTYRVETVSSGMRESTIAGNASVDGSNMRMVFTRGDGMLFNEGMFLISQNGGRTAMVFDPLGRTFYVLQVEQLGSAMRSLLDQFGGLVKISVINVKSSVRQLGSGGTIEKYPTTRSLIDTSYTLVVDAMGEKTSIPVFTTIESWTTDRISAGSSSPLQTQTFHTGFPEIDRILTAYAGAQKGFPLKQVMTMRVEQKGKRMETRSTTRVTNIASRAIPPAEFAMPKGYTKVLNPIEKMVKVFGK